MVKSLTAQGTEQIDPSESEQEASGQGGRSGADRGEVSPREKSIPPVEADSSSPSLGEAVEELPSGLLVRVEERVEMRVGWLGSSSELEAELIPNRYPYRGRDSSRCGRDNAGQRCARSKSHGPRKRFRVGRSPFLG